MMTPIASPGAFDRIHDKALGKEEQREKSHSFSFNEHPLTMIQLSYPVTERLNNLALHIKQLLFASSFHYLFCFSVCVFFFLLLLFFKSCHPVDVDVIPTVTFSGLKIAVTMLSSKLYYHPTNVCNSYSV